VLAMRGMCLRRWRVRSRGPPGLPGVGSEVERRCPCGMTRGIRIARVLLQRCLRSGVARHGETSGDLPGMRKRAAVLVGVAVRQGCMRMRGVLMHLHQRSTKLDFDKPLLRFVNVRGAAPAVDPVCW